jgi:2-hydroxychromene-2-carboxylate isomerase
MLTSIAVSHPEKLIPAMMALFEALWIDRKRVGEVEVVTEVLRQIVGEDITREAFNGTQTKEIKDLLTKKTQDAFDSDAFGLPWFEGI